MHKTQIKALLPAVFQRTLEPSTPLDALLDVMDTLHAPAEEVLAELDRYFSPYRAPDKFVPYLASWVDISRFFGEFKGETNRSDNMSQSLNGDPIPSGMGCLRELIAAAARLSRWRGTTRGLIELLEIATGVQGISINEQVTDQAGVRLPFHMEVVVPTVGKPFELFINHIVALEKPVYVTYDLKFE